MVGVALDHAQFELALSKTNTIAGRVKSRGLPPLRKFVVPKEDATWKNPADPFAASESAMALANLNCAVGEFGALSELSVIRTEAEQWRRRERSLRVARYSARLIYQPQIASPSYLKIGVARVDGGRSQLNRS